MTKHIEGIWAGTEGALNDYVEATTGAAAAAYQQNGTGEGDAPVPRLFELQGNIGVVSVKGPLTNRDAWYNRYLGVTSYNEIRDAMLHAAQNPDVKHILLDVDSGGGAVAGVADTSNLIRMVNDKVKPVTAFTDGSMASAAYWLGSSAGKVYASKTAMVGSIGVIATHMENSRALKDAGIGVTVLRSGKYKALANGAEPLTDAAKAQLQDHLDAVYKVFVQHVAEARNVSYDMADSQMAQGREFMGEASVGAGLTDGTESYDSLFNRLSKELIDASANLIDNSKKSFQQEWGMGKKALSEIEIAALAEGGAAPVAGEVPAPAAEGAAPAAEAGAAPAPAPAAAAEGGVAPATEEAPAAQADNGGVIDYLKGQLKEKDAELLAANLEVAGLRKDLDGIKAAHVSLMQIAGKSASNMRVALGGSALSIEGMSAEQILAEHAQASAQFANKFKAGGVAAVDAAKPEKVEQAVDALSRARLKAVVQSKSK